MYNFGIDKRKQLTTLTGKLCLKHTHNNYFEKLQYIFLEMMLWYCRLNEEHVKTFSFNALYGTSPVIVGRCYSPNSYIVLITSFQCSGIDLFGKNAVVCGRSKNVGMPIATLMNADGAHGKYGFSSRNQLLYNKFSLRYIYLEKGNIHTY